MIKFFVDSISRENKKTDIHVAHIKIIDDDNPDVILAKVCVAYRTKEQFEADLKAKTDKLYSSAKTNEAIKGLVEKSLSVVENNVNMETGK